MNRSAFAVAITGTRSVGKDTLFTLLRTLDPRFVRYAFADAVRADLAPFVLEHYGIDIWTCLGEQKELIRPLLIAHGMAMRARDPAHWVKRTIALIEQDSANADAFGLSYTPTVTDCRFVNEAALMRATFPGFMLVNVTREGSPPPTEEEEKHYRAVASMADHHLHWGGETEAQQMDRAREVLGWLRT